ncbi:MAG TPA: HAMP domain-containing sensor histidine kinase [Gaiellaceae bacterium]|nr:HAMP domain-containing sensor histidine kinase [Gaiellaceae bacterium]
MRRAAIRIRVFILAVVLVLLAVPSLAGGAAYVIERHHQQIDLRRRLGDAYSFVAAHHATMQEPPVEQTFTELLDRHGLAAQIVLAGEAGKREIYLSPSLGRGAAGAKLKEALAGLAVAGAQWTDARRNISAGPKTPALLITDVYYHRPSQATRALVGLVVGVLVLLAGLAVAVWLAGRWMVAPLAGLSAQVDKVAGGDLEIAVPHSRIREIANIGAAVEGMTAALGEAAQRRGEADDARRFLVTSVAHDLRTPLFALRGHLQAIRSGLGDPALHLQRAEARADSLERLIGNLFAYTRDDYAQPTPHLEATRIAELVTEVATGLDHTARLRGNTFALDGDRALDVVVDRDRFKRALTNVVDNALRYSPPGEAVHVSWSEKGESIVELTVRDHGPGIGADLLPHVFEPGVRGAPSADGDDDGAGLGLTIAKRLLEHQHASLEVRNQERGGASVTLSLRRSSDL